MIIHTVHARQAGAKLDSNVATGGGTDDTAVLQAVLDRAKDGDGVRLAALLISKLRFERLIRASAEAEQLFAADPEAFAQLFRRYHESIPPVDFFPPREAQRFRRFLAQVAAASSSEGAEEGEQGKPIARR